jgi:hypothetical protein
MPQFYLSIDLKHFVTEVKGNRKENFPLKIFHKKNIGNSTSEKLSSFCQICYQQLKITKYYGGQKISSTTVIPFTYNEGHGILGSLLLSFQKVSM